MQEQKSILILGAGFGGVAAARKLGKKLLKESCCTITVVDRQPMHLFTPLLYELATAFVEHKNLGSASLLRSGVALDNAELFARWGVDFVQAEIEKVDHEHKQVVLSSGISMRFDYLVVALGTETNFFNIPGMEEHASILKTSAHADRLRQRVHDLLHKKEKGKIDHLNIVIGGAGATGVELASELTLFLRQHMMRGHLKPEDFTIRIIEGRDRVLPAIGEPLSGLA